MIDFEKKALVQARNTYAPNVNLELVKRDILEQKVPGELRVNFPGNGGVTSIVFMEKQRVLDVEPPPSRKIV